MSIAKWMPLLAVPILSVAGVGPAAAQAFLKDGTMISGKYRKGNEIVAVAVGKGTGDPGRMYRYALQTLAMLARDKGYPRFAVTKISDCGTTLINGSRAAVSCRMLGRMLQAGEVAEPEKGHPVSYYRTEDVLAGSFRPES